MLEHLLQFPHGVWTCDMIQQALPRSTSKGLFEVRTSQPCPVHQAHLITTTKYNLGGNIMAPTVGRVLDLVFKEMRGYENTRISGLYTL